MIQRRNFSGQPTPAVIDLVYQECNFSFPEPRDVGGRKRGVRLFPDDDTPRTFIRCNLTNAEPPPGSTVVNCNTTMKETNQVRAVETVIVDGETLEIAFHQDVIHGRWDPASGAYVDLPVPREAPTD